MCQPITVTEITCILRCRMKVSNESDGKDYLAIVRCENPSDDEPNAEKLLVRIFEGEGSNPPSTRPIASL